MVMAKKRIIIDTDLGIDDALAILLALASPELDVEALTVVSGACEVDQGIINALSVLELANMPHIPVARGFMTPLVRPLLTSPDVHNITGLGYAKLPSPITHQDYRHAVDLIIEKIMAEPEELTIVTIGPLTNLAIAIRREPKLISNVKEVISMGGAIRESGNITPQAEFNMFFDPHAAHIVFHSGIPLTLVPLDVTYKVIMTYEDLNRIAETPSPISNFILDAARFYIEFYKKNRNMNGCALNDPLTLALTFAPELVKTERLFVDVDISEGVSMGKTFADFYRTLGKEENLWIASEVKPKDLIQIFVERIAKLSKACSEWVEHE